MRSILTWYVRERERHTKEKKEKIDNENRRRGRDAHAPVSLINGLNVTPGPLCVCADKNRKEKERGS